MGQDANSQASDFWRDSPRGRYLMAWEARQFDLLVSDIFGFHALQIGLEGWDLLRANRMSMRLHCANGADLKGVDVCTSAEELPFASQSLDMVLLPHVLEFSPHPHQVLREVERVLMPEGQLLISGFNPYSLWGIRRSLAGNLGEMPWEGQYLSALRVKDWLSLLGFEHRELSFGCFAPPVASEVWLRRWSFMDSIGCRGWPVAGAVYILHAVKRVAGMRLILPGWRARRSRQKAMLPVAHRQKASNNPWNK